VKPDHTRLIKEIQRSMVKVPPPRKLKKFLDNYIVGQESGKKVMSVAVYNHYLRINDKARKLAKRLKEEQQRDDDSIYTLSNSVEPSNKSPEEITFSLDQEDEDLELSKSNILLLGPSGSGKTLIAKTLARVLNVPFSITDCTQLTQAGYIGEDVELCIERLLVNSDYNVDRAEKGIVVLDEVDKLAKPSSSIGTKDVSGEGVQQALLKLIEGTTVQVQVKRPVNKDKDSQNNTTVAKKTETFHVDTSNILFVLMGAFVGLDKHVLKRITSNDLGKTVDSATNKHTICQIDLEDGRTVGALSLVNPQDLTSYGMIPELVGRVPIISSLDSLDETDLLSILTEPKNALLMQYQYIFEQFGVKLVVTNKALSKISELALREGTGARGLRGIMERLLLNVNYECPDSGIQYVLVNSETVDTIDSGDIDTKYYARGDIFHLIEDVLEEDKALGGKLQDELNIKVNDEKS
jgi:ATP-dependent Clp protease ATP-binding subunit ClpX